MPQNEVLVMKNRHSLALNPSPFPPFLETCGGRNPAANFSFWSGVKNTFLKADYKNPKRAKVLLIEDDRTMRRMVSASLRDHCDLMMAQDITEGFSLYNTFHPDCVFMDIELPESDGHGLLSLMLWDDPDAFVVMFSGHSDNNNVMKSLDEGARGFVAKPFDVEKMLYFIHESIATN